MMTDNTHANNQHHHLVVELPPVTIQVNSNNDINIEGTDIININNLQKQKKMVKFSFVFQIFIIIFFIYIF